MVFHRIFLSNIKYLGLTNADLRESLSLTKLLDTCTDLEYLFLGGARVSPSFFQTDTEGLIKIAKRTKILFIEVSLHDPEIESLLQQFVGLY